MVTGTGAAGEGDTPPCVTAAFSLSRRCSLRRCRADHRRRVGDAGGLASSGRGSCICRRGSCRLALCPAGARVPAVLVVPPAAAATAAAAAHALCSAAAAGNMRPLAPPLPVLGGVPPVPPLIALVPESSSSPPHAQNSRHPIAQSVAQRWILTRSSPWFSFGRATEPRARSIRCYGRRPWRRRARGRRLRTAVAPGPLRRPRCARCRR